MGVITTHLVTELDRLVGLSEDDQPRCPECSGLVEVTPTHAVTCIENGSDHYRWELPIEVRYCEDPACTKC